MGIESFNNQTNPEGNEPDFKKREWYVKRSDGSVENDWKLESVGKKYAVVKKEDKNSGEILIKTIPIDEFTELQKRMIRHNHSPKKVHGRMLPRIESRGYSLGDNISIPIIDHGQTKVENDWILEGYNFETNKVHVYKNYDGAIIKKEIDIDEFNKYNK